MVGNNLLTSRRAGRLEGPLPAPYVCSTTPFMGGCKKAATVSSLIPGNKRSTPTLVLIFVWIVNASALGRRIASQSTKMFCAVRAARFECGSYHAHGCKRRKIGRIKCREAAGVCPSGAIAAKQLVIEVHGDLRNHVLPCKEHGPKQIQNPIAVLFRQWNLRLCEQVCQWDLRLCEQVDQWDLRLVGQ